MKVRRYLLQKLEINNIPCYESKEGDFGTDFKLIFRFLSKQNTFYVERLINKYCQTCHWLTLLIGYHSGFASNLVSNNLVIYTGSTKLIVLSIQRVTVYKLCEKKKKEKHF